MPEPATGLEPQHIKIIKGNPQTGEKHKVDADRVVVDTTKNHRVRWSCPTGSTDWLVVFNGPSPFERDHFDHEHAGNNQVVVAGGDTEYKYTVYVDGKIGADPIIIIRP